MPAIDLKPGVRGEFTKPVYERVANDWYEESRYDALAFLLMERFSGSVWDPSCGAGNIPKIFLDDFDADRPVFGSDVVNRGWDRTIIHDFLGDAPPTDRMLAASVRDGLIDNLVFNPPYSLPPDAEKDLAWQFVEKALRIARHKVAILHRLAWGVEGAGSKHRPSRSDWLETQPLARVWTYPWRVSVPPGQALRDGTVKRGGGAVAYAWFVFEHGWQGPAQFRRIRRPVAQPAPQPTTEAA